MTPIAAADLVSWIVRGGRRAVGRVLLLALQRGRPCGIAGPAKTLLSVTLVGLAFTDHVQGDS